MKIVIDISENEYRLIKEFYEKNDIVESIYSYIYHGTPLPEHHGRLIDADRLTREEIMPFWYHLPNGDIACPKIDIDHAPTIIEGSESE